MREYPAKVFSKKSFCTDFAFSQLLNALQISYIWVYMLYSGMEWVGLGWFGWKSLWVPPV